MPLRSGWPPHASCTSCATASRCSASSASKIGTPLTAIPIGPPARQLGLAAAAGVAGRVFRPLAEIGVNVDMIVQNSSAEGRTDITFTVPEQDVARAEPALDELAKAIGAAGFTCDSGIAKISIVGAGMRSHPGVAAEIFEALAEAGINIEIISTSSIRVSCVVRADDVERAVQAVHARFQSFAEERVNG